MIGKMRALTRYLDRNTFNFGEIGVRGDPEIDVAPAIVVAEGQADELLGEHIGVGDHVAAPVPALYNGVDRGDILDGSVVAVNFDGIPNAQMTRKGYDNAGNQVLNERSGGHSDNETGSGNE